jgi:hypothetical protein
MRTHVRSHAPGIESAAQGMRCGDAGTTLNTNGIIKKTPYTLCTRTQPATYTTHEYTHTHTHTHTPHYAPNARRNRLCELSLGDCDDFLDERVTILPVANSLRACQRGTRTQRDHTRTRSVSPQSPVSSETIPSAPAQASSRGGTRARTARSPTSAI